MSENLQTKIQLSRSGILLTFGILATLLSLVAALFSSLNVHAAAASVVSGIAPVSSLKTGGDTVTVTGSGFDINSVVKFNGTAAATTFVNSTTLTAVTPAMNGGPKNISVKGVDNQSNTLVSAYTLAEPLFKVTSVAPSHGPSSGGQVVTLTGENFSPTIKDITSVSVGTTHSCGIYNGQAYCWGSNATGVLGDGSRNDSTKPVAVNTSGVLAGKTVSATSVGTSHTCVVANGQAYCWGTGASGRLGNNAATDSFVPVAVDVSGVLAGKTVTAISAGTAHTCAVASGLAYCWGLQASYGQLGNNLTVASLVPVAVDVSGVLAGKTISSVSAGNENTCAVADGRAYCWGNGTEGRLGNATTTTSKVPVAVDVAGVLAGKTVTAISVNGFHACAVADAQAYCWGNGANGRLGNAASLNATSPVAVTASGVLAGKTIRSLSAGASHSCVVASDGLAYCWGYNTQGQLGNNTTTLSTTPVAVNTAAALAGKTIDSIAAGNQQTCAVASDNKSYCWGYNASGQLGNSSVVQSSVAVASTLMYTAAPAVQFNGVLGKKLSVVSNTSLTVTTPQVTSGSVAIKVTAYDNQAVTLASAYTSEYGPTISSVTPNKGLVSGGDAVTITGAHFTAGSQVLVGGVSVQSIVVANDSTITATVPAGLTGFRDVEVVASDGQRSTLKASYEYTNLAPSVQAVNPASGPVVGGQTVTVTGQNFTPGTREISQVTTGTKHTCGIYNQQAYCWGSNTKGQLGNNTRNDSLTPVAVDMKTAGLEGLTIKAIGAGEEFTCVIASNNLVYCWGSNADGRLGSGAGVNVIQYVPAAVSTATVLSGKSIEKLSVGKAHACVVDTAGVAYCWGYGYDGQLGNGGQYSSGTSAVPVAVTTTGALLGKTVLSISAGTDYTCAVASDNKAYCWGNNANGKIGNGSTVTVTVPTAVDAFGPLFGKNITSVIAGMNHTCATSDDNAAYCWGSGANGVIGDGQVTTRNTPVLVNTANLPTGVGIKSVSLGYYSTCALGTDNQVYCWGQNTYGQLGNSSGTQSVLPIPLTTKGSLAGLDVLSIDVKEYYVCAIASDNQSHCWGYNNLGRFGNNATTNSSAPTPTQRVVVQQPTVLIGSVPATNVRVLSDTSIAVVTPAGTAGTKNVTVTQYDAQSSSQPNAYSYMAKPGLASAVPQKGSVAGGDVVVLTGTNFTSRTKIKFDNAYIASVSYNSPTSLSFAVPARPYAGGVDISVEDEFGMQSTIVDGFTYVEVAPVITSLSPNTGPSQGGQVVTVNGQNLSSGVRELSQIAISDGHACGIYSGRAYCWGLNSYGQLGNNTKNNSSVPVAVDTTGVLSGKTIASIATGASFTCAVSTDGLAYCWGRGVNGMLGNNTTADSATPVAVYTQGVLSGKTITKVSTGSQHTCVVTSDGRGYCWGYGYSDALGNGVNYSSGGAAAPVAVVTSGVLLGKDLRDITAGGAHTCALDTTGKAYCWGTNTSTGPLGNGTTTSSNTPVAVDTYGVLFGKNVQSIVAGSSHTCAVDSESKVYCWGQNNQGQYGDGTTVSSSLPVSVPYSGDSITSITAGTGHTCVAAKDGSAYCTGSNAKGQNGDGTITTSKVFTPIVTTGALAGKRISSIAAGGTSTCAVAYDEQGYCWGYNLNGQLGTGDTADSLKPVSVQVVKKADPVIAFGGVSATQIQPLSTTAIQVTTPARQAGLVSVSLERYDTAATTLADGYEFTEQPDIASIAPSTGVTTGGDNITISGRGFQQNTKVFVGIFEATSVTYVNSSTLAFTVPAGTAGIRDITVRNPDGQKSTLASSFTYFEPTPILTAITPSNGPAVGGQQVTITGQNFSLGKKEVSQIVSAANHSCGIYAGAAYCWGLGTSGRLGTGSASSTTIPTAVSTVGVLNGKTITSISAGSANTCAIASDKQAYCWGHAPTGTLGNNIDYADSYASSTIPVAVHTGGVLSGKTITSITTGGAHACAVASDGQAYCWGASSSGQLGNGSTSVSGSNAPVAVDTQGGLAGKTVLSISAGALHTCVIASDNQAYCWGAASRLGQGTTAQSATPVAVSRTGVLSGKSLVSISAGDDYTCAVSTEGAVYCWGLNINGQLGDGTVVAANAPVLATAMNGVSNGTAVSVAAGYRHTCAVGTNGSAYCWGLNDSGELGNGTMTTAATAQAVSTAGAFSSKSIRSISSGKFNTCAIASDNQSYCWGSNIDGQHGNGSTAASLTPTAAQPVTIANVSVLFGTTQATNVQVQSATTITATTPAHARGVSDVSVQRYDSKSAVLANSYQFTIPPLAISLSKTGGSLSGGETVTLTGQDFISGLKVKVGTRYSTSVTVVNATTATFVVPAGASPVATDVTAEDAFGQTSTLTAAYTYKLQNQTIASVAPNKGTMAGGSVVTITGSGFSPKESGGSWYEVWFGDIAATDVTYVDDTTLRATTPATAPGVKDVQIKSAYTTTATLTNGYTFLANSYAFTNAPLTTAATEPGKLTITARNAIGNAVVSTSNTLVTLSTSSSTGLFARSLAEDEASRWAHTTVTIPAGQASVDVWYKDSTAGSPVITGVVEGVSSFTNTPTITSIYKFQVSGVSDPVKSGVASSITVRVTDYTGTPVMGYTGTFKFTSTDLAAQLPANTQMKSTDYGIKTLTNGVTMKTQGERCVTVTDIDQPSITGTQCAITVQAAEAGTITKLAIISKEQRISATDHSAPITIQTQSADGRAIPVAVDTPIYLYSNASNGAFSSNQTQWTSQDPLTVTIPAGSSSVNVYFKDSTSRTTTISARDLTADTDDNGPGDFGLRNTKQFIVTGAGPRTSVALSGPLTLLKNENGTYTLELRDSSNQPLTALSDTNVTLMSSTATGRFVTAADPVESNTKSIIIPTGEKSVTFQFKDSVANVGTQFSTITAADSRAEGESGRLVGQALDVQIVTAYAAKSTIKAAKAALNAGEIVQVTTTLSAADDTVVYASTNTTVNLSSTSATGEFSLTQDPFVPVRSLTLAKGESTRTLFFRNTLAGSVTIRAAANGLTTVEDVLSVTSEGVSSLRITASVANLPYDTASNIVSVGAYDLYGNVAMTSSDQTVYLFASEGSTRFATSASGPWNVMSVVIPAGQSTAQFFMKDASFHDGDVVITAAAQSPIANPDTTITRAEHTVTVVGQPVASIVISTPERSLAAGAVSDEIKIKLRKDDGTPSIQDGKSALTLQVAEGRFVASTDSVAASISSVTVPAGQSEMSIYYTGEKIGEYTFSVTKSGVASVSQTITVSPASASVMRFAGIAQTTKSGSLSDAIRVNFVDAFNNAASFSSDQTFAVTSSCSTGLFSLSASSWSDTTSFTVAAGATDATFYYKDTTVGSCTLSVTHQSLETITQPITIISSAPTKLLASVSPTNPINGQRVVVTVSTLDEDGNIRAVDTPTTVYISSTSATGSLQATSVVFGVGESSKTTFYTDTTAGSSTLSFRDQVGVSDEQGTMTDTSLPITYTYGSTKKVSITPSLATIRVGELQKLTVGLVNENNIATPATAATTVTLGTDSTSALIKDQLGNVITQVVIPQGSLSVDIFLSQNQSGTTRVSAQSALLDSASANITTLSETVNEMRFKNLPYTNARALEVGEPGDFRVELYDVFGNVTTTADDITLHATTNVSSSTISDAGVFTIRAGTSSANFTYTQNSTGNFTLNVSNGSTGGLAAITQNGQVVTGTPTDFVFSASNIALERGAISEPITVELRNSYGASVKAGVGGKVVSMKVATGTGTFATDTNGAFTETLDVIVPEGESSAVFYYRNDDALIELRRCNDAIDEKRVCSTETTYAHTFQGRIESAETPKSHQIDVRMSYGEPVQLSFTTPARTQEANRPSYVMTVERQNQYGKAVPLHENARLYLDTNANGTGEFGSSKVKWGVNSVLILDSQASANFYYRDTAEGERLITASDSADPQDVSALVSATQPLMLLPTNFPLPVATNFLVTNISDPQSQGNHSSVIVIARDNDGYIVDTYDGTVAFTSDDPAALLPQSYTFDPDADKGSKTFTNQVAFTSPGEKTVTATDTNGVTGSQTDITVTGANTLPVVSVEIVLPEVPLRLPINTSSKNITVELRDANGDATTAPVGGLELVLASTLGSTQYKLLPSDGWSDALTVTIPAGLSFANFYLQGTETGSADITARLKTNPATVSNVLTVVVSDIALTAETTVRSKNAFGQYQDSTYLFAHDSTGSVEGRVSSRFEAKDTFAHLPVALNWQSKWVQGSTVLGSKSHTGIANITLERTIATSAGAEDVAIEVEAVPALRPTDIKKLQQAVKVSPWTTNTSINKQSNGYALTTSLQNNGQAARAAFAEVLIVPTNTTSAAQAVARQRFTAPQASINYFVADNGLVEDGTYRALVVTYDSDNKVTSQELTTEFKLDSSPEIPTDPSTEVPGETVPVQPDDENETPGGGTDADENTKPETGEPSDNGTIPPIFGGDAGGKGPGSGASDGKTDDDVTSNNGMSDTALKAVVVSAYVATSFLAILFIREAYKEFARVVRLRSVLNRESKLAMDKNTFLALSAHYLRTPITILDAASSMVISPDNALQKAVAALRAKANALLDEGVEKNVAEIQNPDIAKATRSALLSVFFWLPVVLSIAVTIAVTMLLNAAASGQTTNPTVVYAAVTVTAVALIALFGGRTVYINKERVRMEKALESHRAQLFEAKSQFIVGIRTEINEEVARVKQFANYATIPENVRAMLVESVQSLDGLIGKLAIAARINSLVTEPSAFTVNRLIDATVEHYQAAMQARRVTLARHYDAERQINQDGRLLSYVTGSVLDNAIQYGKEGSTIDITTKKLKGATEMTIANDTNLTEGVEGIFEPFNHATTPGDLTVGGAGLSLYLDKLIMNHLGGDITAKGARGENRASIRITFPSL